MPSVKRPSLAGKVRTPSSAKAQTVKAAPPRPSAPSGTPGLAIFAGSLPLSGSANGKGAAARFSSPIGVVVDPQGNAYVADANNNIIRKITPAGVVSTLAGTPGVAGSADGQGAAARFSCPQFLALDAQENLFVSDYNNNTIRKITPSGQVSTLAGTAGIAGSANGQGPAASFNGPCGLAFDRQGNLLVADASNNTIRMVTAAGVVTTLAGAAGVIGSTDGAGCDARFNGPIGLALDGAGHVYVTDSGNNTLRKITPSGQVSTLAGTPGQVGFANGKGGAALFNGPFGLASDRHGKVWVVDMYNNAIRKVTPTGRVSTVLGAKGLAGCIDGDRAVARCNLPMGVALDRSGNLIVTDNGNNTLRRATPAGAVSTLAGKSGGIGSADAKGTAATFSCPVGIAVDSSGNLYVADSSNFTLRKITPAGLVSTLAGKAGAKGCVDGKGPAARFGGFCFLAVDGAGNVYVADKDYHVIRKVTPAGVVSTVAGKTGEAGDTNGPCAAARFNHPSGLAVNAAGTLLYVPDRDSNTVRQILPGGLVSTLAGTPGVAGSANGQGAAAAFDGPLGGVLDASGNLYLSDTNNGTIRMITPEGLVSTLAGTAGLSGSTDGLGPAARFNGLGPMALDGAGHLYVSDCANNTIRKITLLTGQVTTVVGVVGQGQTIPGPLPASVCCPEGLAVAPGTGQLYIAVNNAILAATFPAP